MSFRSGSTSTFSPSLPPYLQWLKQTAGMEHFDAASNSAITPRCHIPPSLFRRPLGMMCGSMRPYGRLLPGENSFWQQGCDYCETAGQRLSWSDHRQLNAGIKGRRFDFSRLAQSVTDESTEKDSTKKKQRRGGEDDESVNSVADGCCLDPRFRFTDSVRNASVDCARVLPTTNLGLLLPQQPFNVTRDQKDGAQLPPVHQLFHQLQ